jgi:formylglycine-generating enzyme required for sulfatase activity
MNKNGKLVVFFILVLSLIISGCGPGQTFEPTLTPVPPLTPIPISTNTQLPTAIPTATPTAQPTATATVKPTATPILSIGSITTREDGMVMVYIPSGPFTMGSNADTVLKECQSHVSFCQRNWFVDEEPIHTVTLDAYWIDQNEVTNGRYAKCEQAGICRPPSNYSSSTRKSYYGDTQYANYPVIYVDWNQAQTYCEWVGAKLPSEAQWEKASRGTDGRTYPWGEGIDETYANFFLMKNGGDTKPVRSYESGKSTYGAYDLAGNVFEWVADLYDVYPGGDKTVSPDFGTTYRIERGGGWGSLFSDVRSAVRFGIKPDTTTNLLGFRCTRSQ